jgi:hypothetical protein
MIVSSKELMKRIAQSSYDKGEISTEEYQALAEDLGIVKSTSQIRTVRIDTKTGKILDNSIIRIEIVEDTVFLYIDNGRIPKIWRMPIEKWEILRNPTELEDEVDR